jgi:hypothetical protein
MKNKKLLYGILGILGIGALVGGYFLYKKFNKPSFNVNLQKQEEKKSVLVNITKNNKVVYSTVLTQRNLKDEEAFEKLVYSTGDFSVKEFQKNYPLEYIIGVELYDSKGTIVERNYETIRK